jgi:hypothetical protein
MNKNLFYILIGGAVLLYFFKKNINKTELKKFKVQTKSGGNVNVREKPDVNSNIVTSIPNGAIFSGEIYNDNWVAWKYQNYWDVYINRMNIIEI